MLLLTGILVGLNRVIGGVVGILGMAGILLGLLLANVNTLTLLPILICWVAHVV